MLIVTSVSVQNIRQIVTVIAFLIIRFEAQNTLQKPLKMFMLRSGEVEAVKVHYLVPCRYKVVQELLLGILTSIDFRDGPE